MERAICLAMGYVFGLFQTGYLYSKSKNMDIRNYGSGNAGSTNVLRVMGVKAGLIVFLGDAGKMILACLLTRILYAGQTEMLYVYLLYTGLGVILGHNYPFYLKFKGGKGIAVLAGLVLSTKLWMVPIPLAAFIFVVAVTRYVSAGSLLVTIIFLAEVICFGQMGGFAMAQPYVYELYLVTFLLMALAWWRHRANIKRLLNGTENKIGSSKK